MCQARSNLKTRSDDVKRNHIQFNSNAYLIVMAGVININHSP